MSVGSLGAATEALFQRAFAESPLITAQAACKLLCVDEKTLRAMADGGVIRSVIVGVSTRRFTEADLRAFLAGERFGEVKAAFPSTARRRVISGAMTSSTKRFDIVDLWEQQRMRKLAGSKKHKAP